MIGRSANDDTMGETDEQRTPLDRERRADRGSDDRRAHPSRRSRRGFLGGMAGMGIGVGTVTPGPVLQQVENLLSQVDEEDLPDGTSDGPHDPHTVATFEAIIDAVVPNTRQEEGHDPVTTDKVGEELDDIHQYGGLDTGMTGMCIDILNDFMSPEVSLPKVANTGETAPLSEALAATLDVAASELVARGGNEDQPQFGRFGPTGGPFASLSRTDRFRALYDVENRGNQFGDGEAQMSEALGTENGRYSRTGSFVVALAVVFPPIVYYSDMNAYDDFIDNAPSEREFDPSANGKAEPTTKFWGDVPKDERRDTLLGWAQTGYPGITEGHDALLGYELTVAEGGENEGESVATGYGKRRSAGPGPRNGPGDDTSKKKDDSGDDGNGEDGPLGGRLPDEPTDWFIDGGPR